MSQPDATTDRLATAALVTMSRHVVTEHSWNYPAELIIGLSEPDAVALLTAYAVELQATTLVSHRRHVVWLTVRNPEHGNVGLHFAVDTFRVQSIDPSHWIFGGRVIDGSDNRVELHFVRGQVSLAILIDQTILPAAAE